MCDRDESAEDTCVLDQRTPRWKVERQEPALLVWGRVPRRACCRRCRGSWHVVAPLLSACFVSCAKHKPVLCHFCRDANSQPPLCCFSVGSRCFTFRSSAICSTRCLALAILEQLEPIFGCLRRTAFGSGQQMLLCCASGRVCMVAAAMQHAESSGGTRN